MDNLGLTEWDIEFLSRMSDGCGNSGYLVITKTGLAGRTFHRDNLVNGKQPVYIRGGGKELNMLCSPETLKVIGFIDQIN